MAKLRTTPFPVGGDRVLADDGSTWTYEDLPPDEPGDGAPQGWVQGEPWLSAEEREAADEKEREATQRLAADHRVYAMAFGAVPLAKPEVRLNESDSTAQFALALAVSAMRDSIIEVATGERPNLEQATLIRLRTFLGDPEVASAQAELARMRRTVADDLAPETVTAKARGAIDVLGELAGKLPSTAQARATITQIVSSPKAMPELSDKLFREVFFETRDAVLAEQALAAAAAVAQAHG